MGSRDHNERITNLAMPERRIPVLIESAHGKSHGFVSSGAWSDKPITSGQRLDLSFVMDLKSPQRRREIEREHGTIKAADWNRLRGLVALLDRLNAGDWTPIVAQKQVEWSMEETYRGKADHGFDEMLEMVRTGRHEYGQGSGHKRVHVTHSKHTPIAEDTSANEALPHSKPGTEAWDVEILKEYDRTFTFDYKTAAFALSEEFTAELAKARFVVWWAEPEKKLAPGLYCPEVLTGLYALVMWSSGTPGGLAICRRCGDAYLRRGIKKVYCSPNCRVAHGMQRQRKRDKAKRISNKLPSGGS